MRPTGPFFATPVGRRATSAGGHFCETKPIRDAADCLAQDISDRGSGISTTSAHGDAGRYRPRSIASDGRNEYRFRLRARRVPKDLRVNDIDERLLRYREVG